MATDYLDKPSCFQYGEVLTPFVADKSITELGSEHAEGEKGIHDRLE